jgi:hypothetical protein
VYCLLITAKAVLFRGAQIFQKSVSHLRMAISVFSTHKYWAVPYKFSRHGYLNHSVFVCVCVCVCVLALEEHRSNGNYIVFKLLQ